MMKKHTGLIFVLVLSINNYVVNAMNSLECSNPKSLGLENGAVRDSQITASSQWDQNHGPANGRLHFRSSGVTRGSWSTRQNDLNQWLQVDFQQELIIVNIATQGREDCCDQWVKSYTIFYSNDGKNFHSYKPNGHVQIFSGNNDRNSIVRNVFSPAIVARYIRVNPKTWNGHISMRVDFYGCNKECSNTKSLGVENGDSQITASSQWNKKYGPTNGRLNFRSSGVATGSWSAKQNDLNQWLQVEFQQVMVVISIATQGREGACCDQWVTSYTISYSNDGNNFHSYKPNGLVQLFTGNNDKNSIVRNVLSPAIVALYMRVNPKTWNGHISMRVGFYGCNKECNNTKSLGLENRVVRDSQITASSQWDKNHGPENARLNFRSSGETTASWSVKQNDLNQWLQVDFLQVIVVINIATQGRGDRDQWVKSYIISYSNDGNNFHSYKTNGQVKIFSGNNDKNSIVQNVFSPAIVARYIRVNPRTWNGHISMRVEFYDCKENNPIPMETSSERKKYPQKLSSGSIAGFVIGILLTLALAVAVAVGFYCIRRRKKERHASTQFDNPILYSNTNTDQHEDE